MHKSVSLTFIILFFALKAFTQSAIVEGIVVEESTQQPLEFSTVALYTTGDNILTAGTVSDVKGKFILKDIKEGSYYLAVQFLGYETIKVPNVIVSKNQSLNLGSLALNASAALLKEMTVNSSKVNAFHQIDKSIYTASQFQSAQGGTVVDVLKNLPSVSVNSDGEITLRGSSSFIVLLDGKPTQSDPSIILNQLPANIINNVEVVTTPSSKYDPDGKAGIINITTKKGATDGYYFLFNAQGGLPSVQDYGNENKPIRYAGDVTANIKKDKWNFSLSANYKRDDISGYRDGEAKTYLNNTYTTFPSLGERSYRAYSYSVKGTANYQISKKNNIEIGFYAGKRSQFRKADILYKQKRSNETTGELVDSLNYFNKNMRERKSDFIVANIDYNHVFENKSVVTLSALYEKTILGGPTDNADVNPEDHSQLYTHAINRETNPLDGARVKADYTLPSGAKGKFEMGYQYRYLLHKGDFTYNQVDIQTGTWSIRPDLSSKGGIMKHTHQKNRKIARKI